MSKFYLPNLNLEYHLCRWAKKIDGSTVALAIFLRLGHYKIFISYKSKVLLHFHVKKYKIKDNNFIISLPLVGVRGSFQNLSKS